MTPEFMQKMTEAWPGYWGVPLKDLSAVDTSNMGPLSKSFTEAVRSVSGAINNGNFGYYTNVFFPAATQTQFIDIETVWYGEATVSEFLDRVDKEFQVEFEKGLVPPIPEPAQQ